MDQGIIKKFEIENKQTSDPNEINNEINIFFKKLKTLQKPILSVNNLLESIILPILT